MWGDVGAAFSMSCQMVWNKLGPVGLRGCAVATPARRLGCVDSGTMMTVRGVRAKGQPLERDGILTMSTEFLKVARS